MSRLPSLLIIITAATDPILAITATFLLYEFAGGLRRESAPAGEDSSEERPRRKLRYAPIVVLESKKKEAEKFDVDVKEASKTSQSAAQGASENDDNEKKISQDGLAAKSQASQNSNAPTKDLNNRPIDLVIGDDNGDDDEDHDLGGVDKDKAADWVKVAQKGFAC